MTDTTVSTPVRTLVSASHDPHPLLVELPHLIRKHGRGMVFWALAVTIFSVVVILAFPAFENSSVLDVSQYPESLREAFNLQSLTTIEPYLSSQVFNYLPLVLMFVPITIFAGAIAGAEERGSLDLLFGNPLPRPIHVVAYWLAVAIMMLALLIVLGLANWLTAVALNIDLGFGESMGAALNVFPITMAAGGIALALSATVRQRAVAIGVPAGVMFLMYLADVVGKIATDYSAVRDLSFFKAYGDPLQEGMPWLGASVLLLIAVALAALAISLFNRRDIYT